MRHQPPIDLSTETARIHQQCYAISEREFLAWLAHRNNAFQRGIPFRFSLLAWSNWWRFQLRLKGPDARRGRNRGNYVMARIGDQGAYEHGNVACLSHKGNAADRDAAAVAKANRRITATRAGNGVPRGYNLKGRGAAHPKSREVLTPAGAFPSLQAAAEHHGVSRQRICQRLKAGAVGWSYASGE